MKKTIVIALGFMLLVTLAFSAPITFAGFNNQNSDNGIQGTGKINHLDGCRPDQQAGNYWVFIPVQLPSGWSNTWEGGPCCPHRARGPIGEYEGEPVYLPNQCCNPPDEGVLGVPGNHCLCFMNRGWPIPNALP